MIEQQDNTIFYPFSPGIPWKIKDNCIEQFVSVNIWNDFINNKPINKIILFCPGHLLECLCLPLFKKAIESNDLKVDYCIVPKYYENLLKHFDIDIHCRVDGNVFDEYNRLRVGVDSYPVPIFKDKEGNIYFNCLFNYGVIRDIDGEVIDRNMDSYWKQLMNNACINYLDIRLKVIDKEVVSEVIKGFFYKFGVVFDRFVLIDNDYKVYENADGRTIITKTLHPYQLKSIVSFFSNKKIGFVVSGKSKNYGLLDGNMLVIPPWEEIDSFELICLLIGCMGLYSSDPNIYLSAGMLGNKNIFAGGNFDYGWELMDIFNAESVKNKNWKQMDSFDIKDILNHIVGKS